MDLRARLIAQADQYCATAKISRARLATIVVNDGKFFSRIEHGGDFTVRTFERFQEFFEKAEERSRSVGGERGENVPLSVESTGDNRP